jgi:molybdopterin converting factor small subunit
MTIEINLPPSLQTLAGGAVKAEAGGSTVGECLAALAEKYSAIRPKLFNKRGALLSGINIFVNGENVYPNPLARPVREGDKIHIAFTVLGG